MPLHTTSGRLVTDGFCQPVIIGLIIFIHCVSKNVRPLTCYNLDIHDPIAIIFGRNLIDIDK